MESIQWNSSFNSSFHVNPSSTPFNFPRTLVKTSSFNELGNSSFDSVLAPKLDAAMFSGLSSAVLAAAAAGNFVPSSTISPFFHSIQMPALSRSISSEYTATPAVASVEAASELESPDSDSRSLCLSPDEQETQDADREQNPREMAELDLHPTVNSPRSEADSDEWSVPATNNETDSANQSHTRTQTPTIPIIKNSSLMDITAATHHAGSAAKTEEFSDSENNDDQEESDHDNDNDNEQDLGTLLENQRENDDDNDNDELAEVEEDEAEAEVEAESDIEEEVLARPTRSSRRCKASKQKSKINSSRQVASNSKQGRRGSSARKAPISSAARLASQKKYDEKRRGIYRRLYTDLKDAIRAAQEVEGVKRDALEEQRLAELKRGKKKKKKKQKEIEDLSTRELLMLATNTIQLLQNHKNQLDQEWSQVKLQTAKEENEGEENVKPERADRKRKRGGVKNEKQMKINNRSQTMGADSIKSESDCSPPKRSRTDSTTTSTSSSSSSSSNVVNALLAALNNSQSSHQVALPLPINPSTMSWSNTPIKPEFVSPSNSSSSSSTSAASPLLLLGANSASSSAPVVTVIDEAKRRAIFLFLFLRLRSLVLSSPPLLSVLQTSNANSGQLWKSTLMSLLNCEWTEESVRVVPQEKLLVKMSQMIWALQCMQQDIEVITAGQKNPQMKEHWANVATVKRELESYAGNNVTNDS